MYMSQKEMTSFKKMYESKTSVHGDKVTAVRCHLVDISMALCKAFEGLDTIKKKDLTLTIGRQGSGRSTFLSYCSFGPD